MPELQPIIIKKRKAAHHGAHSAAWKVAYADFITAMMAFFMVLWIMGLSQDVRTKVQGYFNDPFGFVKNEPMTRTVVPLPGTPNSKIGGAGVTGSGKSETSAGEIDSAKRLAEEIKRAINTGAGTGAYGQLQLEGVEVTVTSEGVQIEFLEKDGEVFFELGKARIRPAGRAVIDRIAPVLAKSGRKIVIDGHTDARPYPGTAYDNWDLSGDRAAAMRRTLRAGGVRDGQIVAVRANADRRLRRPDAPLDGSNRRVSVMLPFDWNLPSIAGLPTEAMLQPTAAPPPVDIAPR